MVFNSAIDQDPCSLRNLLDDDKLEIFVTGRVPVPVGHDGSAAEASVPAVAS